MKKKLIAMILAVTMSCQLIMINAAEIDFSGTESIFVDDAQTNDSEADNSMASALEDGSNEDEATIDEIDIDDTIEKNFGAFWLLQRGQISWQSFLKMAVAA